MDQDFTLTFLFDQSPHQVFEAIRNVRAWWSELIMGETSEPGDEFVYQHKDLHISTQRVVESIPGRQVVWLVLDSKLSFVKPENEWTGTRIRFDVSKADGKTMLRFTHEGLHASCACFDACSQGWSYYLGSSLVPLITKGKGQPDTTTSLQTQTA